MFTKFFWKIIRIFNPVPTHIHSRGIPNFDIQFTCFDDQPIDDADGVIFVKPAAVLLDDGKFTIKPLPGEKPTHVKIDWTKSKPQRVPQAVRRYFLGTNQRLYVRLPDASGEYTVGGWVDGMKVRTKTLI